MSALLDRVLGPRSTVAPLAVSGLQLVPRGAVALAEHVNRYYRVLTGADAQQVMIRLPTGGGAFQVLHSATGAPVLNVTDAGIDVVPGGIGNAELADGSVTSAKIADGTIMDADVAAAAAVQISKLQAISANNVLVGNGTNVTARKLVDNDVDPNAAVALAKLAHVGAGNVLKSNGTQNVGGKVVDNDVAGIGTANINEGKIAASGTPFRVLATGAAAPAAWQQVIANMIANNNVVAAHVYPEGAANANMVLRSGAGANSAWGKVATGDIAANSINGDRILDGSITSAKLSGASVPAGSITTTEIADGTIMNADVNAAANIAVSKLAAPTPNVVLAVGGSAPATWQQVAQAMLANNSVGLAQLIAGSATFISTVAIPTNAYAGSAWNTLTGSTIAWTSQGGTVLFLVSLASCYMSSGTANVQFGIWNNNAAGIQAGLGLQNLNSGGNVSLMGHYAYTPAAGPASFAVAWQSAGGLTANAPSGQFTVVELRR